MEIPESMKAKIAAQDALADGVYLVVVHDRDVFKQHAVFSTFERAREWMQSLPNHLTAMCAPFVTDCPDLCIEESLIN